MDYKYTVSIPHYNSPELLKKMLNSIPEREDIQVIVVDDGSDECNKAILKTIHHKNLNLILLDKNHGGGYARNIGLSKSLGRWFISVDADDYFFDNAFDTFDKYLEKSSPDVVIFCWNCVDNYGNNLSYNPVANKSVLAYLKKQTKKTENLLRFKNTESCNKLVSLSFIQKNKILFENCRINIDVFYSLLIGLYAKNILVIPDILYNVVLTDNSITRKKRSIEREFQFYLQVQKRNEFYKKIGLHYWPYYRYNILYVPFMIKKRGIIQAFQFFSYLFHHKKEIEKAKLQYLNVFNK